MDLKIPPGEFDALLFDCDGTLVDSMPLHFVAWCRGFEAARSPYPFSEDTFYANAGVKEEVIVEKLNTEHGASVDPAVVVSAKAEAFESLFEKLQPIPAVVGHARDHFGKIPLAVVSGSESPHVNRCLNVVGIADLFETVVTPPTWPPAGANPFPTCFSWPRPGLGSIPNAVWFSRTARVGSMPPRPPEWPRSSCLRERWVEQGNAGHGRGLRGGGGVDSPHLHGEELAILVNRLESEGLLQIGIVEDQDSRESPNGAFKVAQGTVKAGLQFFVRNIVASLHDPHGNPLHGRLGGVDPNKYQNDMDAAFESPLEFGDFRPLGIGEHSFEGEAFGLLDQFTTKRCCDLGSLIGPYVELRRNFIGIDESQAGIGQMGMEEGRFTGTV